MQYVSISFLLSVCAYYSRNNSRIKQCKEFGCFSIWKKIGTTLVLDLRGCWNKQLKQECTSIGGSSLFCACKKEKCLLPSSEQIKV